MCSVSCFMHCFFVGMEGNFMVYDFCVWLDYHETVYLNMFDWNGVESQVSRSKKGIRNGPKALKPQPVIIRCK